MVGFHHPLTCVASHVQYSRLRNGGVHGEQVPEQLFVAVALEADLQESSLNRAQAPGVVNLPVVHNVVSRLCVVLYVDSTTVDVMPCEVCGSLLAGVVHVEIAQGVESNVTVNETRRSLRPLVTIDGSDDVADLWQCHS